MTKGPMWTLTQQSGQERGKNQTETKGGDVDRLGRGLPRGFCLSVRSKAGGMQRDNQGSEGWVD